MTQAFNLSQLANKVNTSGQLDISTGSTGTLAVANGGTGATTLTANNVVLGNGTSAVQFVAPSTNGNVLTSNGTTWTSAALSAGGMTLLGTVTANANSVSLGSLSLSTYKYLYISVNNVSPNNAAALGYISDNNRQTGTEFLVNLDSFGLTATAVWGGSYIVDLTSGVAWGQVGGHATSTTVSFFQYQSGTYSGIFTSTTTIYFRLSSTYAFDAGSFVIYGVK